MGNKPGELKKRLLLMLNMPVKQLKISDARKILEVYNNREIVYFPRIINYSLKSRKSWIEFEWLDGKSIDDKKLPEAFFNLGKMHRTFQLEKDKQFLYTVCHGDFNKSNILIEKNEIKFIDTAYTHLGWNYTDLDYIDLYDFFDKKHYPWIIKDAGVFDSYLEGAKIQLGDKEKALLKKKIGIYSIKKYMRNGQKCGKDIGYETKCLKTLLNIA